MRGLLVNVRERWERVVGVLQLGLHDKISLAAAAGSDAFFRRTCRSITGASIEAVQVAARVALVEMDAESSSEDGPEGGEAPGGAGDGHADDGEGPACTATQAAGEE